MPFRSDNALVRAAAVIQRITDYRPAPRMHELWRERVSTLGLDADTEQALLDANQIDAVLAAMPNVGAAAHLHACTHTTFSCNVARGSMKTNVIPDAVDLEVDVRTLPGEGTAEVQHHLDTALGDLAGKVDVELIMNDPATISPVDTPLWDALQRAVARPFPTSRLTPQMSVGFTDSRIYRAMGAVSYGAALFSPSVEGGEYSKRFHGNDERVDVESLALTTQLWLDVVRDMLG